MSPSASSVITPIRILSSVPVKNAGLGIDGKAFAFQSGGIYKIILVSSTSKNWQFTFTV